MAGTARRTNPELWETVKAEVTAGEKGGHAGQWSARKAQFAVQEYKRRGGGYEGGKKKDNSLKQWTDEEWQTADGSTEARGEDGTDRYLPKKAWEELSDEEKEKTRAKKKDASRKGQGTVDNADEAKQARKDAKLEEMNADDAVKQARNMSSDEAEKALEHEKDTKDRKTVKQKLEKVAAKD